MRFLVLYEELASYFLTCLNHLAETSDCKILLYMKKVNPVAPFNFDNIHKNITVVEREKIPEHEFLDSIKKFSPDFTYVSGWIHKPYLKTIKQLRLKNVIMGFDNQYTGSLKQILGAIYFKLNLKRHISAAFVPGASQKVFAKKLGFKEADISLNVYCCDHKLYADYYDQTKIQKQKQFPKRLIFVGRYVREKGIDLLWESFIEIQNETPNEWELWCVGKGSIEPVSHPKIKHLGFIQPKDLLSTIQQTGVYVLPSFFEPWGVALHEFAAAGFPIISTPKVGATEVFVNEGKNGFLVAPNNKTSLKAALKKIVSLTDTELLAMGEESVKLSTKITPEIWKQSLLKLVHGL
jgi:glycosyltransferase involved in cell wall biosynthesis